MIPRPRLFPLAAAALALVHAAPTAPAATGKYRLIWNHAPESSVTVAWCQRDGENPRVHFRAIGDDGPSRTHGVDHATSHLDLESRFARLTGLEPDTDYQFVIRDSNSESPRFRFRTAPAGPAEFTFVAGGDSRNHRDARQRANRTIPLLRPLFVCFGGDMIDRPTPEEWSDWLDDWQLTFGDDGRIFPIVAARGNHENKRDVHAFFDTPHPDDYYAFDIGGPGFLRLYTLNSNITRAGSQGDWLVGDLAAHAGSRWKIAHYHHPFRPHQSGKTEQHAQYNAWAPAFYEHGLDLAIECDSHVVKRTWPVRPSNEPGSDEGFIRDDASGITFIGEGCWGAPLRANDDDKSWTRASGRFNQFSWIAVTPDVLTVRTILVDTVDQAEGRVDEDTAPFVLPKGLEIWEPDTGALVAVLPTGHNGRHPLSPASLARVVIVVSTDDEDQEKDASATPLVRLEVDGSPGPGTVLRFTTDGSEPDARSPRYTEPFPAPPGTTIRAALFLHGTQLTRSESTKVPAPKDSEG